MITLTYQDEMQADFDDIRFYTASGDSIDYWIEEKTDSTSADVWVKLPAADMLYIYAYYGNAATVSVSDGEDVFELYSDCSDLTQFTTGGTPTISDGSIYFDVYDYVIGSFSTLVNFEIHTKRKYTSSDGSLYHQMYVYNSAYTYSDSTHHILTIAYNHNHYGGLGYYYGSFSNIFSSSKNTWYKEKWVFDCDAHTFDVYIDDVLKKSNAPFRYNSNSGNAVFIGKHDAANANPTYMDYIYICKGDSAETSFSVGSEENQMTYVVAYPGYDMKPTDPDSDGLYEDVNGNNRLDFQDIMIFFQYNAWAAAHQNNSYFDWSGNGVIEFSDVQLFWEKEFT